MFPSGTNLPCHPIHELGPTCYFTHYVSHYNDGRNTHTFSHSTVIVPVDKLTARNSVPVGDLRPRPAESVTNNAHAATETSGTAASVQETPDNVASESVTVSSNEPRKALLPTPSIPPLVFPPSAPRTRTGNRVNSKRRKRHREYCKQLAQSVPTVRNLSATDPFTVRPNRPPFDHQGRL